MVNLVAGALGVVAIGGLIWIALKGDPARAAEDAARAHYDLHGKWPDE